MTRAANAALFALLAFSAGCTRSDPNEPLPDHGKRVYLTTCIACHNQDPNKNGDIGPALAGSSAELLRARLLEGGYPPGYKPKRVTRVMTAFPYLKDDVEALAAYLAKP
jgi:mono/diheme cytochrome c family protein